MASMHINVVGPFAGPRILSADFSRQGIAAEFLSKLRKTCSSRQGAAKVVLECCIVAAASFLSHDHSEGATDIKPRRPPTIDIQGGCELPEPCGSLGNFKLIHLHVPLYRIRRNEIINNSTSLFGVEVLCDVSNSSLA